MSDRFDRVAVSGASSGIGRAFARRLARRGASVMLIGRDRIRLERAADELSAADAELDIVVADLADEASLRRLEDRLAAGELDLLVNAAGLARSGLFATLGPDDAEVQVRVNVLALMRLTRAVLAGMVARGHGAVINVSSLMAFDDRAGWSPYVATKAFVNRFTENLAVELDGSGVIVQALCPGPVGGTEFFATAGFDSSVFPPEVVMGPDDVAAASLVALRRREVVCVPGLPDPAAIEGHRLARVRVLREGRQGTLAERYRHAEPPTTGTGWGVDS